MDSYQPFYDRYSYGDFREVVPNDQLHARKLSTRVQKNIRQLKGDMAKNPLLDPATRLPVRADEYQEWRRRAVSSVKQLERRLKTISGYCSHFRRVEKRNAKRMRRAGSLN